MSFQPPKEITPNPSRSPLQNFLNKIISIAGSDSYNRERILRTDLAGNLSVVIASGLGVLQKEYRYWIAGSLSTGAGALRFYNLTGADLAFQKVHLSVSTAPTGADLIVDVNLNGVSIFAAGDRPTIAATEFAGSSITFATENIANGDYLTFDIDQVGSSVPGSNLVITVLLG